MSRFLVGLLTLVALVLAGGAAAEMPNFNQQPAIIHDGTPAVGETVRGDKGNLLYLDGSSCQAECGIVFEWYRWTGGWTLVSSRPLLTDADAVYTLQPADAGARILLKVLATKHDCGATNTQTGTQECRDVTRAADSALTQIIAAGAPPKAEPDVAAAITELDLALAALRSSAVYQRVRAANPNTFPRTLLGQAESHTELALFRLRP